MRKSVIPGMGSRAPWAQWVEGLEARRLLAANPLKYGEGTDLRSAVSVESVRVVAPKAKSPRPPKDQPPALVAPVQTYGGALDGKIVYTSGGHGYEWNGSGYFTGREDTWDVEEAFGNQEQMSFFADYVLRAGGTVVPMRPVGHQLNQVVLDNDSPGVTFTGTWANSSSAVYYDEDYGASADAVPYRSSTVNTSTETAVATYQPNIPQAGFYPVYTWALSGANRTTQLYRVNHSGGATEIRVDHRRVGRGWVYLGTYHFDAGSNAGRNVQISNFSPVAGSVIADTIRFGNGMGDYPDGPTISGKSREDEASLLWLNRAVGIGTSAATAFGTGNVSAPSNMAEWMNSAPFGTSVYIGFHSNAGGGRGARGLIDSDQGTPNQTSLATFTGRQINQDMQALDGAFEHDWIDGVPHTFSGDFGEIDLDVDAEMDATIIEVAFHDSLLDAQLLRDPKVRDQIARSTYEATLEYFDNFGGLNAPASQPDEPVSVRASANAAGDITVSWTPPASRTGGPGAATAYRVYTSRNGHGFADPVQVTGTSLTLPAAQLDGGAYYFRVAAVNAGGESPMSYAVGARKNGAGGGGGSNRILVVNGFDRFDRTANVRQSYPDGGTRFGTPNGYVERVRPLLNNTFNYVAAAGEAIEAYNAGGAALGFDSVQNEHVTGALLAQYRTVVWLAGEESTANESFNAAEQSAVASFISGGGSLFVSGSEIGWDLDRATGPTAADREFYNGTLKADFGNDDDVHDDAFTYDIASAPGGSIFAGLPAFSFDTRSTVYDAEFPDVILPADGSDAALNYGGVTVGHAALQWAAPSNTPGVAGARVVNFGFPFETITSAARRNDVMARVLSFFQTAVSATPAIPDLLAASDSGNNADNITNHDNSSPDKALQFLVSGTVAGSTIELIIDDAVAATFTGAAGTTTVSTAGLGQFPDGSQTIKVAQREPGKSLSLRSAALVVIIDSTPPALTGSSVNGGLAQRSRVTELTVTFDDDVTFGPGAITLTRRGDAFVVTPTMANPSGDGSTWVLSFSGAGIESGSLADGIWDLIIAASNTTDTAGNPMAANGTLEVHRLFGDIDGNRIVNNLDYGHFRNAFGKSTGQAGYEPAFDYDANGIVNNLDYGQFRNRFGISL